MSSYTEPMGELDTIIFALDGQAICSLGKNIFDQAKLKDMPMFLSGLISGIKSFSQLLERDIKIVTAIGTRQIIQVIISPEYVIEPISNIDQILLDKRMGIKSTDEMGWKQEPQRGLCIGFKVIQGPFWIDYPDITQGFQLYFLREMAENFFSAFADQIRNFDFNFDPGRVRKIIGWTGMRPPFEQIDLGHPVFKKKMEATVIFTDNNYIINIDRYLESKMKSEAMCSTAATLYTGLTHTFGFDENVRKEGWMVIDFFGGTDAMGSSLFVFGKEKESEKNGTEVILAIAVAEKEKYVHGGKGDFSSIMKDLSDRARKIAAGKMHMNVI
ncbi:MAG: hypothetical protein ACE5R6_01805 [Candidatus Heimdallarchaeota archaeon]